jgi:hypothetical protein
MTMIDLDAFEREYAFLLLTDRPVRELVAELRAAREVVKATRALEKEIAGEWAEVNDVRTALAVHDQAVAP